MYFLGSSFRRPIVSCPAHHQSCPQFVVLELYSGSVIFSLTRYRFLFCRFDQAAPSVYSRSHWILKQVAVVQLATPSGHALVIQLADASGRPQLTCLDRLHESLNKNQNVVLTGCDNEYDLLQVHNLWARNQRRRRSNTQHTTCSSDPRQERPWTTAARWDLGGIVPSRSSSFSSGPHQRSSLQTVTRLILGLDLPKSHRVTRSPWHRVPLSHEQVVYAARDAWVAAAVAHRLLQPQQQQYIQTTPWDRTATVPFRTWPCLSQLTQVRALRKWCKKQRLVLRRRRRRQLQNHTDHGVPNNSNVPKDDHDDEYDQALQQIHARLVQCLDPPRIFVEDLLLQDSFLQATRGNNNKNGKSHHFCSMSNSTHPQGDLLLLFDNHTSLLFD